MENSQQPGVSLPEPQPSVPSTSTPPVPVPAGPAPVSPVPGPVSQPAPTTGSKKGLLIAIAAGVVVLIIAIIASWFLWFSPAAQAQRASTAFMKALTTRDLDKVYELVAAEDDSTKQFLRNAAEASEGDFTLKEKTMKDGIGYFLYDLSNEDGKQGRTIVEKQDGKYQVNSYVVGTTNLALIPSDGNDEDESADETDTTPTESTETQTQTQSAALTCLVNSDYKWFFYNKAEPSVTYDTTYVPDQTFNLVGEMFFKPDTTNEDSFTTIYDDWADFAKQNAGKQWKFRLEGSTYGPDAGTAASKALADSRAQKVQSQLLSRGVPADRIVIDPPHNYGTEDQEDNKKEIYRRVRVIVDPTCTDSTGGNR